MDIMDNIEKCLFEKLSSAYLSMSSTSESTNAPAKSTSTIADLTQWINTITDRVPEGPILVLLRPEIFKPFCRNIKEIIRKADFINFFPTNPVCGPPGCFIADDIFMCGGVYFAAHHFVPDGVYWLIENNPALAIEILKSMKIKNIPCVY